MMSADIPLSDYRTFWRRVGAALIDAVVLTPLMLIERGLYSSLGPGIWYVGYFVVQSAVALLYSILLHAHDGQTVGKRVTHVRVLDVSGRSLTLKQAVLREIPNVALQLLFFVSVLPALREVDVYAQPPTAVESAVVLLWLVLEPGTMLLNQKRRALHDFIAGTVVVKTGRAAA